MREEWKYVSSLSETMSMTASASWETTMSRCRTLPRVGQRGKDRGSRVGTTGEVAWERLGRFSDRSRTSEEDRCDASQRSHVTNHT